MDLLIQIRGNRRGVLGTFGCDGEQCERNREVLMADDDIVRCAEMRGRPFAMHARSLRTVIAERFISCAMTVDEIRSYSGPVFMRRKFR